MMTEGKTMQSIPTQTLTRNLRFLELVPRRGKAGKFWHTKVSRKELAQVYRTLRNEQR